MLTSRSGRDARRVFYSIAAVVLMTPASFGTEAKSDLSLEVRLLHAVVSKGALGTPASHVAQLEVVVDSLREAHDLVLSVEHPDGRELARPRPDWTDARGVRLAPSARGIVVPARGRVLARFEVSLEGDGRIPVVVKAKAVSGADEVSTEGSVFVPVTPTVEFQEADGLSNFPVKGVK
jgi:hypothetical protein